MRRWLTRNVLLPLYEGGLHRRRTFGYWSELSESQWSDRGALRACQLECLRKLLSHAARHCPFYRSAWDERGLDPNGLTALEQFTRWPLIDRETIRENRQSMRSRDPRLKLLSKATGGSSGVPLQFDFDTDSNDRRMAAWHRGYDWAGAGPGTRQLYLWGVPLGRRSRVAQWKDRAYHALYHRLTLNSFELSEESAPRYAETMNRFRPDVIVAYTNPLYTFARMLEDRGIVPHPPKSIVVGAEKLHDFQRSVIERVFRAPVFETYGSREFMLIGAECDRHSGLHLTAENLIVEVVDDDGVPVEDGQEGNVVITDLRNYGMPFIRYRNGDRAVGGFGTCSCGRGLPLLKKVVGRQLDVLVTADGRRIPGEFFPHLVKDFDSVRQFQVVQEAVDRVRILLVLNPQAETGQTAGLRTAIEDALGPSTRVHLERVESIPLTGSGKLRVVVNQIPQTAPAGGDPVPGAGRPAVRSTEASVR